MAHFMDKRGSTISKSIQKLAIGQELIVGVYGGDGLTIGPNDKNVAKIVPQGQDNKHNSWYRLEGLRVGHVMVEAKKGTAVWDFFQLAVGAPGTASAGGGTFVLRGSVGAGGLNHMEDVILVRSLLNQKFRELKRTEQLPINSGSDHQLQEAIRTFQRDILNLQGDGRVDPGGATFSALQASGLGIHTIEIEERWKRDQPAPLNLKRICQRHLPSIKGYGIYSARNIAKTGKISMHAYGCAIDIPANANVVAGKRLGDFIFDILKAHSAEVRFSAAIWNLRMFEPKWQRLSEKASLAHTDHVHVQWPLEQSQHVLWPRFEAAFAAAAADLAVDAGRDQAHAPPAPQSGRL